MVARLTKPSLWLQLFLAAFAVCAGCLVGATAAGAVTSEQLSRIPLLDDLQRNDPPGTFSSSGMGAGKWSTPTGLQETAASRGGAWNTGTKFGYGSPGGWAAAYWNAQKLSDSGNGVAVEATLTAPLGKGEAIALWLNQPNPVASASGYELYITGTSSQIEGTAYLIKWTNGTPTTLASAQVFTYASHTVGTTYALVEKNGEVTAWGGTAGSGFSNPAPFKVTDSSPYKTGYAGLQVYGASPTLDNFSAGILPPAKPTLIATSPPSPAASTTPSIAGTAEAGTTVSLYANSACSGSPVATGSAATFSSPGISVAVGEGSTSTFYASATNSDGLSSACSSTPVTYRQSGLYWGAWIKTKSGEQSPFQMNVQNSFEKSVGKSASIIHWGEPWYSSTFCAGYCPFQLQYFNEVRSHKSIPFLSWAPEGMPWITSKTPTDHEIATKREDQYIEGWAKEAKAWGHPFFLRFAWEMNGSWFEWGQNHNGHNTAADYREMWQHVHQIFTQAGATNVTWVWCPNIEAANSVEALKPLYPGDEYVDWTCLDGYNGNYPSWQPFSELFGDSYGAIAGTIAPTKPIIIGETASTEDGGSKAQWITDMANSLVSIFPKVHGLLWFDKYENGPGGKSDWPIESSTAATSAFATAIQSGPFISAKYENLSSSPIPIP